MVAAPAAAGLFRVGLDRALPVPGYHPFALSCGEQQGRNHPDVDFRQNACDNASDDETGKP
jgi:hypothetical protein